MHEWVQLNRNEIILYSFMLSEKKPTFLFSLSQDMHQLIPRTTHHRKKEEKKEKKKEAFYVYLS